MFDRDQGGFVAPVFEESRRRRPLEAASMSAVSYRPSRENDGKVMRAHEHVDRIDLHQAERTHESQPRPAPRTGRVGLGLLKPCAASAMRRASEAESESRGLRWMRMRRSYRRSNLCTRRTGHALGYANMIRYSAGRRRDRRRNCGCHRRDRTAGARPQRRAARSRRRSQHGRPRQGKFRRPLVRRHRACSGDTAFAMALSRDLRDWHALRRVSGRTITGRARGRRRTCTARTTRSSTGCEASVSSSCRCRCGSNGACIRRQLRAAMAHRLGHRARTAGRVEPAPARLARSRAAAAALRSPRRVAASPRMAHHGLPRCSRGSTVRNSKRSARQRRRRERRHQRQHRPRQAALARGLVDARPT